MAITQLLTSTCRRSIRKFLRGLLAGGMLPTCIPATLNTQKPTAPGTPQGPAPHCSDPQRAPNTAHSPLTHHHDTPEPTTLNLYPTGGTKNPQPPTPGPPPAPPGAAPRCSRAPLWVLPAPCPSPGGTVRGTAAPSPPPPVTACPPLTCAGSTLAGSPRGRAWKSSRAMAARSLPAIPPTPRRPPPDCGPGRQRRGYPPRPRSRPRPRPAQAAR